MVNLTNIRNKIGVKIFDNLGNTCTVYSLSSSSYDKWGDISPTWNAGVSETVVPYNILTPKSFEQFGELKVGELDIIAKYTSAITLTSSIVMNNKNYRVVDSESFDLAGGTLAKMFRLAESI